MPVDSQGIWKPNTSPKQDELRAMCRRYRFPLANGPRYSGKCRPPNAIVFTSTGLKRLGQMRPDVIDENGFGDIQEMVCAWDGEKAVPSLANQFYVESSKVALSAELSNGYQLTGSPGHPIWCAFLNKQNETKFGYLTLTEIQKRVNCGQSVYTPLISHPHFTADRLVIQSGIEITEDIGYLLGALVGDGSCNGIESSRRTVGFTNMDQECLDRVIRASAVFGCKLVRIDKNKHDYRINNSRALRKLLIACSLNTTSYFKRIPDCVIESPASVLCAFLRGLFDTDGTVEKPGTISITTTSDLLADDVQQCLAALDILGVRRFKKSASGRPTWNLSIMGKNCDVFKEKIGFSIVRKMQRIVNGPRRTHNYGYPRFILEDLKRTKRRKLACSYKGARSPIKFKKRIGKRLNSWVLNRNLPWLVKPLTFSVRDESEALALATALEEIRTEFVKEHHKPRSWHKARRFLEFYCVPNPEKLEKALVELDAVDEFSNYRISNTWLRVVSVKNTESELVDLSVPEHRSFLASGFINHNTIGCEHAFAEHGWETVRGNDCIITISQTVGLDSGIWKEFTESIIPEWVDGDFGLKWAKRPYVQGVSKKPTCEITNRKCLELPSDFTYEELKRNGAISTFQLESLQVEKEAEDRFKPRKYTGIYVPELTTFSQRATFDTLTECLRLKNPDPGTRFLFLGDTNPPDDESWWIHDLWWDLVDIPESDDDLLEYLRDTVREVPEEVLPTLIAPTRELKRQLHRIDISVEDNPFADPSHVAMLRAKYAHNDELFRRYINGECVRTTIGSIFAKVFRESFHVIGEVETPANKGPEIIVPQESTIRLVTGTDPGPSNYSFHILEPLFLDKVLYPQYAGRPVFNVLDELVLVGEDFDLCDVVETCVKRMRFWEKISGRKFQWTHWADRSVFDTKVPFTEKMWHAVVQELSGGEIVFQAADRGKGSVNQRIDLLERIFFDDRIFINKNFCPKTVEMVKGIKRGKTSAGGIVRGTPYKHPFDSLTYPIASECADEIAQAIMQQLQNIRKARNDSSMVSISM